VVDPTSGLGGWVGSGEDQYAGMKAGATHADGDAPVEGGGGCVITLYSNGFVVDDGPFRSLDDPANKQFIQEMNRGFVPSELRTGSHENINVSLKDKSDEEYTSPQPPAYVAYSGDGQSTGAAAVVAGALVAGIGAEDAVASAPQVDASKPSTTISVRLHSGKRIRAKLNLDSTVRHLQALIAAEGGGDVPYVLMAGFPPAQLIDFSKTIEASGLAGAQVTQKEVYSSS
jgi:UBX domain-containing protein 1